MNQQAKNLDLEANLSQKALNQLKYPKPTAIRFDYSHSVSRKIMNILSEFRRAPKTMNCSKSCPSCLDPHLEKLEKTVRERKKITFVLPAFPAKSPNREKVLGASPDMAERCALQFLNRLCNHIKEIYSPGAKIILCSDGRVFSDVVGIREEDVSLYQDELSKMIEELQLKHLETFNLDDVSQESCFDELRSDLMSRFGRSLESLRTIIRAGAKEGANSEELQLNRMYCGITRFLVEDSSFAGQVKTRSAIQKECRERAYEVIRRSNAWSELIEERFPEAVRLSIHPQGCGSLKFGIRLMGDESWMTPWHGVAVKTSSGFVLMKNHEAKKLGAKLRFDSNGKPSHYVMNSLVLNEDNPSNASIQLGGAL